jgi:hypothetical protein
VLGAETVLLCLKGPAILLYTCEADVIMHHDGCNYLNVKKLLAVSKSLN